MSDYKGVTYLKNRLAAKQSRIQLRYDYYEMKNIVRDLDVSTPPQLRWLKEVLGWCAKGVDNLADRLVFREFKNDNFGINEIFQVNNPDIMTGSAELAALISSCSFIYIYPDNDGRPRLQVIDGYNATGEIDPVTGLLKEGYAVLSRNNDTKSPLMEAYFLPKQTIYHDIKHNEMRVYDHPVEHPLLVPIIYRPDSIRPFGHSRISRACMALQNSAIRTLKRSEITAEFYSYPQKWITNLAQDADDEDDGEEVEGKENRTEKMDRWGSTITSMLTLEKDDEGDHPIVGQFSQASVQPHLEQIRMFAAAFAGEVGLTIEDLGFPQANPSSAEAIKASHTALQLTARAAQRTFGTGFLNAGYLAACLRDEYAYKREAFYQTKPAWEPIFEPDMAALGLIGDGALKINQAVPGYFGAENMRDLTGIEPAEG